MIDTWLSTSDLCTRNPQPSSRQDHVNPFLSISLFMPLKLIQLVLGGCLNISTEKHDYFIGKFCFLKKYCIVVLHVLPIFIYLLSRVDWKMETLVLDIFAKEFPLGVSGRKLMDLNFFPSLMYTCCYNSDLQFNIHYSKLFSIALLQNSFRGKSIMFNWLIYSSFLDGID